jgi:hypothetical protein
LWQKIIHKNEKKGQEGQEGVDEYTPSRHPTDGVVITRKKTKYITYGRMSRKSQERNFKNSKVRYI